MPKAPPFTVENAAEMGRRSAEARAAARERREAEQEQKARELASAGLNPVPLPLYVAARLERVRQQLDRLDGMLLEESDPARLDRLCSAQSRLSEQERVLSGRPLPGSHRPTASRRRPADATPILPE